MVSSAGIITKGARAGDWQSAGAEGSARPSLFCGRPTASSAPSTAGGKLYIYIYIYIERERYTYICVYIYIYIYI